MREIKFRAWDKEQNRMFNVSAMAMTFLGGIVTEDYKMSDKTEWVTGYELMQYTGLKDKNGLTYIYESDIIGVDGIVKGNKYENESLLQDRTNLIIEGFGTKGWWATYKEAMVRGCQDSE